MSTAPTPVFTDWTAEGHRPAGQPGTVNRNHRHPGWEYPAVKTADGRVWYWRDTTDTAGTWIAAPPILAASFEAAEEWRADCPHFHGVPYRTCDTQSECDSLTREQERTWGR